MRGGITLADPISVSLQITLRGRAGVLIVRGTYHIVKI